ncbi:MAG TPA: YdeI/OmpD-associated family protein [Cyclobacteriaceae bacterium]|nr:YdeI/OmpD-associated family protein [Cyclobacteriaceae bacterium]
MNPKVDWFFNKAGQWQDEYNELRKIALASGLTEELKWGCPCYTLNGTNVVLIHGFKNYCAYLFHKGVLLNDPKKILIQQTANVQAARQIRFTHLDQITDMETTLNAYLKAAIKVEKSGAKVELKKTTEFEMPDEFKVALKKSAVLQKAFKSLTPGRQRGYLLYFASAKQMKTREERIKKYTPAILKGKGLDD